MALPEPTPSIRARRTKFVSWSPSGWLQSAAVPAGTGVLAVGCGGAFRAVRVGIPNAGTDPFTIARMAASASADWSDYVNPTSGAPWTHLTFAGQGELSDAVVSDPAAPREIIVHPAPAPALPGSGRAPRWTWTDWTPLRSAGPDRATGMHVLMLRWLNTVTGQRFTFANGNFGHGWTGLPEVNHGFDYAMGGYNNGADFVTAPAAGDMHWQTCRHNGLLNGTPLAIVQFLTERDGIVGMVAGDSHHSGTGTTNAFNNFLAQLATQLGRKHAGETPFGFVNCAVGGIASAEIFAHLRGLLPAVRPSFVVLPGWTYNEAHDGIHADAQANAVFFAALRDAAAACRRDGAMPIILTPFPRNQAAMTAEVLSAWRDLRDAILRLRSEGALVVDGGAALDRMEGDGLSGTYRAGLSDDTLHPNDRGHARVAAELAPVVQNMCGLPAEAPAPEAATPQIAAVTPGTGDAVPVGRRPAMKTLIFCTSYAESLAVWNERWGRWLRATTQSGVVFDKLLIVDDGSPVLPDWPDVEITPAETPDGSQGRLCIHHFADRRGQRVNGEPFPGWYRSFAHAVLYAIRSGYDRIIHIESDAFLITDRAVAFFNSFDRGWAMLWCRRHRWPESTLQIICSDQFEACAGFFSKPYVAHLGDPIVAIEKLLPTTFVNKTLIGDRYGEDGRSVPFGADYVSQVLWNKGADYYWWLSDEGTRRSHRSDRPTLADVVGAYELGHPLGFRHGGIGYREFFNFLDTEMCPATYLEIGTQQGSGVEYVSADILCIDPHFVIDRNVIGRRSKALFFQMNPDDFFRENDPTKFLGDIDLGFLDGLHHFEALLRDFINFERHSHTGSIVLLHDCLPLNTRMASRDHKPGPPEEAAETRTFWTGDVWRILPILQEFRPDLDIVVLDCPPTGLVLCAGLDNRSDALVSNFDRIVEGYSRLALHDYGLQRLWTTLPFLSSRKILAQPRTFCERFRFRR